MSHSLSYAYPATPGQASPAADDYFLGAKPSATQPSSAETHDDKGYYKLKRPHVTKGLVKVTLVTAGVFTLAQLAVGVWLILAPKSFLVTAPESHGTIDYAKNQYLRWLPTISHVTLKTSDAWLGAMIALAGLWLWERRLVRHGASLEQMGAWGSLISSDTEGAVRNFSHVGIWPVVFLIAVKLLTAAASTGVVNAVTTSIGTVTVSKSYNAPSFYKSDPNSLFIICDADSGALCPVSDYRGVVLDTLNTIAVDSTAFDSSSDGDNSYVAINSTAVKVNDLGVANPNIIRSYASSNTRRDPKFGLLASFKAASMCMEGIEVNTSCVGPVTTSTSYDPLAFNGTVPNILTISFADACGARNVTSGPHQDEGAGVMDFTACTDATGQPHMTWMLTGGYAGGSSVLDFELYHCSVDIVPVARTMDLKFDEHGLSVEQAAKQSYCPLTSSPLDIRFPLSSSVNSVLHELADPDGGFKAIYEARDKTDAFRANLLSRFTQLAFTSTYSALLSHSLESDSLGQYTNYGGGGTPGYVTTATETYNVRLLGAVSRLWLIPLVATILAVLVSFILLSRRSLAFDPADAASVAVVALGSSIDLRGGCTGRMDELAAAQATMYYGEDPGNPNHLGLGLQPRIIRPGKKYGIRDDEA